MPLLIITFFRPNPTSWWTEICHTGMLLVTRHNNMSCQEVFLFIYFCWTNDFNSMCTSVKRVFGRKPKTPFCICQKPGRPQVTWQNKCFSKKMGQIFEIELVYFLQWVGTLNSNQAGPRCNEIWFKVFYDRLLNILNR